MRTSLAPFLRREQQELTMGGAPEASTSLGREEGGGADQAAGLTFTQKGLNKELLHKLLFPLELAN